MGNKPGSTWAKSIWDMARLQPSIVFKVLLYLKVDPVEFESAYGMMRNLVKRKVTKELRAKRAVKAIERREKAFANGYFVKGCAQHKICRPRSCPECREAEKQFRYDRLDGEESKA